jgi:hypothetical protein
LPSNYFHGNSDSPSSNEKSKSNRKRKQQIQKNVVATKKQVINVKLHSNMDCGSHGRVPWWKNSFVEMNGKAISRINMASRLLNGFTVKESSLQHLSEELAQFGEYVKLTPTERQVRQSLITIVQDVCVQIFGIEQSLCRVFGSFAVPSVCTFGSDIDLAIWGVVATKDTLDHREDDPATKYPRKRSISLADSDGVFSHDEEPQHLHDHPNRKKQERVLKWKKVIDCGIEQLRNISRIGQHNLGWNYLQIMEDDEQERGQDENDKKVKLYDKKAEKKSFFVFDRIAVEEEAVMRKLDAALDEQLNRAERKASDDISRTTTSKEMDTGDEESDDADKLEHLWYRQGRDRGVLHDNQIQEDIQRVKRPRGQSMVSVSSVTTCSEDDRFDDSGLEVSYTVGKSSSVSQITGPTGRNRTAVVNALYKISRRLRPYATTLQVRKKASEYLFQ